MTIQAYRATIDILITADSEGEACDAISGLLSELPDNGIIDWSYVKDGTTYTTPKPYPIADTYCEGDFLT